MAHYVDLHIHSQASDGTWTPEELVNNVKKAGILTFAVTDHDATASVTATKTFAQREGLSCINGVEFSSLYQGIEYHILAYDFELNNPAIQKRLQRNQQFRNDFHDEVVVAMAKKHPSLSFEAFAHYDYDRSRGGWKSLNYLMDHKLVFNMYDYFNLLDRLGISLVFDSPREVIEDILAGGAVPILAHPPAYNESGMMTLEQLREWVDFGISGFECYSPYYQNPVDSKYYVSFCENHGLYVSGGSDCHGTFVKRKLRNPSIIKEQLHLPFLK